jgi:hypothetical protein
LVQGKANSSAAAGKITLCCGAGGIACGGIDCPEQRSADIRNVTKL